MLQTDLNSLLESGYGSDLSFTTGAGMAKPLKAHKVIVAARSTVFRAMLFGSCSCLLLFAKSPRQRNECVQHDRN